MLPIHKVIWHEWREQSPPVRVPEPSEAMEDPGQIRAYVKAYEWGGATSALQLYHLRQLSRMIRPGDTVVDLACGPGPLLLELAALYPDCHFIGVDLSQPMLDVLMEQARERSLLANVETRCEDIRALPSFGQSQVDMVITTSALHHLPDLQSLHATFARVHGLLKSDGGFYAFDFGLLRSAKTRALMVNEVARLAPEVTVTDYKHSLDAAFSIDDVIPAARSKLQRSITIRTSSFVDFFYFISTGRRHFGANQVSRYTRQRWAELSLHGRWEFGMLQLMQEQR